MKTRVIIQAALDAGELPICYMLRIMRDEKIRSDRRDEMAKAAANFFNSRIWLGGIAGETEPEAGALLADDMPSGNGNSPELSAQATRGMPAEADGGHATAVAAE